MGATAVQRTDGVASPEASWRVIQGGAEGNATGKDLTLGPPHQAEMLKPQRLDPISHGDFLRSAVDNDGKYVQVVRVSGSIVTGMLTHFQPEDEDLGVYEKDGYVVELGDKSNVALSWETGSGHAFSKVFERSIHAINYVADEQPPLHGHPHPAED